ncbi:MAG: FecR domain-containing protein [Pseudomonadota bacterium]
MKNKAMALRFSQCLHHWVAGALALVPALLLAEQAHILYVVRPGETLTQISQQHLSEGHHWQELARTNGLVDPQRLQTGQRLRIPVDWLAAKPAAAQLLHFSGAVQTADLGAKWQAAQPGALLQTGHQIKIGRNSSATLRFADGSELVLQPDTELALDTVSIYAGGHMTDTRLRLQSGRVEVRANPNGLTHQKLNVITPSAITAVRGTQFMIEAQPGQSLTQTTQGSVELLNPQGKTMVPAGYGSHVKLGQAPLPPTPTPPAPTLQQAASRFTAYPIQFTADPKTDAIGWTTQVGPSEGNQMRPLAKQIKTTQAEFELGLLDNGHYLLRTWYIDAQGMPSNITQHAFEVQIARKLQQPAVAIQPALLEKNLQLQLPPAPDSQRYLLQLTQDAQGQHTIWYAFNAAPNSTLPAQSPLQNSPYHLWIWAYSVN